MGEIQKDMVRNIIVIGASAGGFSAIAQVLSQLPATINASVFTVLHISEVSNSKNLAEYYQKYTSLICTVPADGTIIQRGHMYLAPPNYHMMVKSNTITINQGTRENKYRPSIDVLFRSAAVHYGSRVIGIILSGMLDDGTSGMTAIKRCGGICIVQEPSEAEFSDMPQSVVNQLQVDYKVPLKEIGNIVKEILSKPLPREIDIPNEIKVESEITEKMMSSINKLKEIADQSLFTCPDCGGGLWAIRNEPVKRYRCHTGHVYTENLLYDVQGLNLEESVWVSIRMLEERRNLLSVMATNVENTGNLKRAQEFKQRSNDMGNHIEKLKIILTQLTNGVKNTNLS